MKRTGGTMTITVDPAVVSVAESIRTAAEAAPLLVVSGRAFGDLAEELGSMDAAAEHLQGVAEAVGRPIAVNLPAEDDGSSTVFISPRSWTEERLAGWVGGHHEHLEREFGRVSRIGPNRTERRRRQRED